MNLKWSTLRKFLNFDIGQFSCIAMFYVNNTIHDSINPNFPWIFHNLHQMLKTVHSSSVEYLLGTYGMLHTSEPSDKGRWTQSELELSRIWIIQFIHILSVDFATFSPFSFN